MNHSDVMELVDAAREALGWTPYKGLPKAEPDMAATCVLACAFDATLTSGHRPGMDGLIQFNTKRDRDVVEGVWRERGVVCERYGHDGLLFGGELYQWMRHFDRGDWSVLILDPMNKERPHMGITVEAETLAELDAEVERVMAEGMVTD